MKQKKFTYIRRSGDFSLKCDYSSETSFATLKKLPVDSLVMNNLESSEGTGPEFTSVLLGLAGGGGGRGGVSESL